MKNCRVCGVELNDINLYSSQKKQYNWICKECITEYCKQNKEKIKKNHHEYYKLKHPEKKIRIPWNKGKKCPQLNNPRKKGHVAWNKDTKGMCKPNSGSFEKGMTPWNKIGDGISRLNKLIRGMPEYSEWRNHVFGRDLYTCQYCNIRGVYFEAHHIKELWRIIKEYNMKTIINARNCIELWNLNNGITLCKECHRKTDMSRSD